MTYSLTVVVTTLQWSGAGFLTKGAVHTLTAALVALVTFAAPGVFTFTFAAILLGAWKLFFD